MKKSLSIALRKQSDSYILRGIARLIATDRKRKSDFMAYLNEVDCRKLYAVAGYSGLCEWLVEVHRMSESSALKRIQVAKLAAKYKFLYESVARGDYTLSSLVRIAPHVKEKNAAMVFRATHRRSVREVEQILADMFPNAEVEDGFQKAVTPLGLGRHKVQFDTDDEFVEELETLKGLLSHRYPQGRMRDVMKFALKTTIRVLKGQARAENRTRNTPSPSKTTDIPRGMQVSRHIPASTRSLVENRDDFRCQHRRPDGTLCGATRFLEVDHIQPFALGGSHRPQNLRLLCWAHNALRAELRFGKTAWKSKTAAPS